MVNTNTREYKVLQTVLAPDEKVGVEIFEHKLGGAQFLSPAHVYATDRRIIIIRDSAVKNYRKIKIINYNRITEVKLDRGFHYCKLHFGIQGEEVEKDESKTWVYGINYEEGMNFIRYINQFDVKPSVDITN